MSIDLTQFTTKDGIIQDLGKFEGEPIWVPYFYDLFAAGEGEDVYSEDAEWSEDGDSPEPESTMFIVDHDESAKFDIPCGAKVHIRLDGQGFVTGWIED